MSDAMIPRMVPDKQSPIVLASASPRRRRLLRWLGLSFEVASVQTAEDLDSPLAADPGALAASLAAEKADATRVAGVGLDALVLCFDTIVVLDEKVLGKPADSDDAWRMLRTLSGRTHQVVTGMALLPPRCEQPISASVTTNVQMRTLSDGDIETWMAVGEFMGCAGAYNIEGQVAEVTTAECYQNVAGLPLCHLYREIRRCGPRCLAEDPSSPIDACDAALARRCALGPRVIGT